LEEVASGGLGVALLYSIFKRDLARDSWKWAVTMPSDAIEAMANEERQQVSARGGCAWLDLHLD